MVTTWVPVLDGAGAFLHYVRGDALAGLEKILQGGRRRGPRPRVLHHSDAPAGEGAWVLASVAGRRELFRLAAACPREV